jgi:hypothetical protein
VIVLGVRRLRRRRRRRIEVLDVDADPFALPVLPDASRAGEPHKYRDETVGVGHAVSIPAARHDGAARAGRREAQSCHSLISSRSRWQARMFRVRDLVDGEAVQSVVELVVAARGRIGGVAPAQMDGVPIRAGANHRLRERRWSRRRLSASQPLGSP